MDLMWPICRYPLGSGGKRVTTRLLGTLPAARSSSMILSRKFDGALTSTFSSIYYSCLLPFQRGDDLVIHSSILAPLVREPTTGGDDRKQPLLLRFLRCWIDCSYTSQSLPSASTREVGKGPSSVL